MATIEIKPRIGKSSVGEIDTGVLEAFIVGAKDKPDRRVAFTTKRPADSAIFWTVPKLADADKKAVAEKFAAHRKTKSDSIVVEETPESLLDGPKEGDK
ncbi:MAG: hypothetical protein ACPGWS_08545 [Solirubrobacterales bacterium]